MTEGQQQQTLEGIQDLNSIDRDKDESELPTELVSPKEEREITNEDKTDDPTIQRQDDTGSDDDLNDQESPNKYLLDEDLEELE